jgi:tRNA(fMet)-specific endonuclease VapC
MILFDTDMLSLYLAGHPQVMARLSAAESGFQITIITWIEVLRGRCDFVLKAADGEQLQRAQQWLTKTLQELEPLTPVPINAAAAAEFDRLRQDRKLKKIGRADLLIAAIALANRATLVTRNLRHFRLVPSLQLENWADA